MTVDQPATPLTQRERVNFLEQQLLTNEATRRKAVADGDRVLHNDLANANRRTIGAAEAHDLRSLVTRWLLRIAANAEKATDCPTCDSRTPHPAHCRCGAGLPGYLGHDPECEQA